MNDRPDDEHAGNKNKDGRREGGNGELDRGWEAHDRRQVIRGLDLTPAQRLRWLEETLETMRRWLGRARHGRPNRPEP